MRSKTHFLLSFLSKGIQLQQKQGLTKYNSDQITIYKQYMLKNKLFPQSLHKKPLRQLEPSKSGHS